MTLLTRLHKSDHYFSDTLHTKLFPCRSVLSLIFIIALFTGFVITTKTTMADNSVFNSDKKSCTIDTPHDKLTQSVTLKKDTVYNDTLNGSSINFYYIDDLSPNYALYIKCIDDTISPGYIQFFDNTYKELNYCPQQKASYLYIDVESILSDISHKKCIYMTISNPSADNDKFIKILYEKKEKPSETTKPTIQHNNNNNKPKTNTTSSTKKKNSIKKQYEKRKNTSYKSKTGNKIKKPASIIQTSAPKAVIKKNNTKPDVSNNNKKTAVKNRKIKNKRITKKVTKKTKIKSPNSGAKLRSVSLSNNYISLKTGNFIYLKATIRPSDLSGCKYIWTTSNSKIATVSNGKVSGKNPGLVIIKVIVKHNNIAKTATCTIRITK